jgi:hypothetical protein
MKLHEASCRPHMTGGCQFVFHWSPYCEVGWGGVYQCWRVEGLTVCSVHALLAHSVILGVSNGRLKAASYKLYAG